MYLGSDIISVVLLIWPILSRELLSKLVFRRLKNVVVKINKPFLNYVYLQKELGQLCSALAE